MAKTLDDLMAAFAGESQANRRYLAFAKKADDEGFPQVARLFRAVAHGETIHALSHLRVAGMVKSTAENLQEAIAGETYEFTTMYPEFITEADTAGEKKAVNSFSDAMEVEKVHEKLYSEALENLDKPMEEFEYYVCPVCGFVHARSAPDKCPVCGAMGKRFEAVK